MWQPVTVHHGTWHPLPVTIADEKWLNVKMVLILFWEDGCFLVGYRLTLQCQFSNFWKEKEKKTTNFILKCGPIAIITGWIFIQNIPNTLQWRHNEHHGISNYQCSVCLLNHSFRHSSKKTSRLHLSHWPLWGEFASDQWITHTKGQ